MVEARRRLTASILSCVISNSLCQLYVEYDSDVGGTPLPIPKKPINYDLTPPWPKMIIFDLG